MKLRSTVTACLVVAALAASSAARSEWAFGPSVSYLSGIGDVVDLYERNLLARPNVVEVDTANIPIGAGFFSRYQADSGLRFDIGIGPAFIMLSVDSDVYGGADHTELPVYGTVGYTFSPGSNRSGYVRFGAAYHSVSGDFAVDSSPGAFAAVGLELGRRDGAPWGFELSVDNSTVEFLDPSIPGNRELHSYDTMLTFFYLF